MTSHRYTQSRFCIALILTTAIVVVGSAEVFQRTLSVPSPVVPGWTDSEFAGRVESVNVARDCIFVGDSRVGWGIADRVVTDHMQSRGKTRASAWNLGLAGTGVETILRHLEPRLRGSAGGVIMLHYSPGSFFYFKNKIEEKPATVAAGPHPAARGFQGQIEQYISSFFQASISTIKAEIVSLAGRRHSNSERDRVDLSERTWLSRTVFDEGFVNGKLGRRDGEPVDLSAFQLQVYGDLFRLGRPDIDAAISALRASVQTFRDRGWSIVMFRLPVGERMRALEMQLPEELQPPSVAKDLGLYFIDFSEDQRTRNFATQDESHLAPASAIAIAPFLAMECSRVREPPRK